jgi:hypothetical protein
MSISFGLMSVGAGMRWRGFALENGVALVFLCEPDSGIRRAYFYLSPRKKVSLEKINPGAALPPMDPANARVA